jgi:hypothetical protein
MAENLKPYRSGFVGMLDEVVLLDRAVAAEEVASYYESLKKHIDSLPASQAAPDVAKLDNQRRTKGLVRLRERFANCDFEEILFATRQPGKDGHWYANFS